MMRIARVTITGRGGGLSKVGGLFATQFDIESWESRLSSSSNTCVFESYMFLRSHNEKEKGALFNLFQT